jgi:putative transposase
MDGEENHVHLLVPYPPKVAVSRLNLARRYVRGVLCSPSYFAASYGGAPSNILREYIEQQKTPD